MKDYWYKKPQCNKDENVHQIHQREKKTHRDDGNTLRERILKKKGNKKILQERATKNHFKKRKQEIISTNYYKKGLPSIS